MASEPNHPQVSPRPTLKTIANMTGLAVATISRALNDAPDIGEDTKVRVRQIADRIGYSPNRAGVRLRTGRTQVISLVLATEANVMNHTARLMYAIAEGLRDTPYHMTVTPYSPGEDPMNPIRYIVETGSADGVVINQTELDDPRVAYMRSRNFPFAMHGRTADCASDIWFDFDNGAYARLGMRELKARGATRVLLVAPPPNQAYAHHTICSAQEAAHDFALVLDQIPGLTSDAAPVELEAHVLEWLDQGNRPDGVICSSSNSAMSVISAFELRGLVIGRDFHLVSKEAVPLLRQFRKEIIVVKEDVERAGLFLAEALVQGIEDRTARPMQWLDQPRLEG